MASIYQPPLERILAELNRLNPQLPLRLRPEMVTLDTPTLWLGPGGTTNSKVTLRPKTEAVPVQYFSGSVVVYYNRLQLPRLLAGYTVPGRHTDYTTARDVVETLAERHRFPLTVDDVAGVLTTDPTQVMISARGSSLGFIGTINLPYEQIP